MNKENIFTTLSFEGDLKRAFMEDFEGDFEGDFRGDFTQVSGPVIFRSGLGLVQFTVQI